MPSAYDTMDAAALPLPQERGDLSARSATTRK